MLYNDYTITIGKRQGAGYPLAATTSGLARVTGTLPPVDNTLASLLRRIAEQSDPAGEAPAVQMAGAALFRWLMVGSMESHLRVAWDRAEHQGRGLRLLLDLEAPEIAGIPWELMYDPLRRHSFATASATPLIRYHNATAHPTGLNAEEAELPLRMLLVLPASGDLDVTQEQAVVQEAVAALGGMLDLQVLDRLVTLSALSDALLAKRYDIVHLMGHGGHYHGESYVELNQADGAPDWVNSELLAQLFANHPSLKLLVLNACSSGQVAEGGTVMGMAPHLVDSGIPAVVAMQYALSDQAALTFAREFYRQLCTGENAGLVDAAISHARNMLAVMHSRELAYAAPVLYTCAADGVLYTLSERQAGRPAANGRSESARLAMFMGSLQTSMDFAEDWAMVDQATLASWRAVLQWAERAYSTHLENNAGPAAQEAARHGLALIHHRLAALDQALRQEP